MEDKKKKSRRKEREEWRGIDYANRIPRRTTNYFVRKRKGGKGGKQRRSVFHYHRIFCKGSTLTFFFCNC